MKMSRVRVLAALVAWLVIATVGAQAQEAGPAQACKQFWVAVHNKEYVTAWNLLSEQSKAGIVSEVATAAKATEMEVRDLFDKHDPTIMNSFWDAFRDKAHTELYSAASYAADPPQGDQCLVKATVESTGKIVALKMTREGSAWHFGLLETFKQ